MDPPAESRVDALNTTTPNLADKPTLADGPPSESRMMPCIQLHQTWQTNLLWPMDPLPSELRREALYTATPNLAYKPTLANGSPSESRRYALHTTTPNFTDELTLADATDI